MHTHVSSPHVCTPGTSACLASPLPTLYCGADMQNLRLCIELANENPSHLERGMPDSQVPVYALVTETRTAPAP